MAHGRRRCHNRVLTSNFISRMPCPDNSSRFALSSKASRCTTAFIFVGVFLQGCQDETPTTGAPRVTATVPQTELPAAKPNVAIEPQDVPVTFVPLDNAVTEDDSAKYRPDDMRPVHDAKKLAESGIHTYESRRLRLHTDIDSAIAESLTKLVDQAYDALEEYFGPLLPSRDGGEFQVTGYVMHDAAKFGAAGLLPEDLRAFQHGRQRGAEFWINDQRSDYYRRHLLLHEYTHCFMVTAGFDSAPLWYLEGMAERFGTHATSADGQSQFGVFPSDKSQFAGLGRIELVQGDIARGVQPEISEIVNWDENAYRDNSRYAWSWALCEFLDTHPTYRERFRELARTARNSDFGAEFDRLFGQDAAAMQTDWSEFAAKLQYGSR